MSYWTVLRVKSHVGYRPNRLPVVTSNLRPGTPPVSARYFDHMIFSLRIQPAVWLHDIGYSSCLCRVRVRVHLAVGWLAWTGQQSSRRPPVSILVVVSTSRSFRSANHANSPSMLFGRKCLHKIIHFVVSFWSALVGIADVLVGWTQSLNFSICANSAPFAHELWNEECTEPTGTYFHRDKTVSFRVTAWVSDMHASFEHLIRFLTTYTGPKLVCRS